MPRKKLNVEQAFAALSRKAALPQDDIVIIEPEPEVKKRVVGQGRNTTPTTLEVDLHCMHSIGVNTYGPGRCVVPVEVAAELLHQEQYAKAVDERVLDTRQRLFQIMPMRSGNGGTIYRGVPVESLDFYTMFYGGSQRMHLQF